MELSEEGTVNYKLTVQNEGARTVERKLAYYNLDMILAIGYRVRSPRGIQLRKYASTVLKDYLIKGFAIDDERLKELGGGSYFKELLNWIRDIRSSEKVFYRQVLDLFSTAVDYNPVSVEAKLFFATVQNKMHFCQLQEKMYYKIMVVYLINKCKQRYLWNIRNIRIKL